jgi:GTPase
MRSGRDLPRVAVLGRQNVGKSTLVNRLIGRNAAIATEAPGVTRDRLEEEVRWGGDQFVVVDTGGFVPRARGIDRAVWDQARRARDASDVVLLVVDAQTGIQEEDATLARELRKAGASVIVVANKIDSEAQEPRAAEFNKLGLGEPVPVSALHGRGSGDLLDRIVAALRPSEDKPLVDVEAVFCLVGRPNVGKSSLFNRLVAEERAVVDTEPGTTRDAVDSVLEFQGRRLRFVDTAGLRRRVKSQGVEFYGWVRSMRAIDRAEVALLVVDASEGLTGEDKRVAARVAEAGRGLVAALNKWDVVPSDDRAGRFRELERELSLFPGAPVVRTSARTGAGIRRLVPALLAVREAWARRVPTSEVNRELQAALAAYPPPRGMGRIRYGTQVSAGPPTFVLFGAERPPTAYRRYLENKLRAAFGFNGVPLRISFRARDRRPEAGSARESGHRGAARRRTDRTG